MIHNSFARLCLQHKPKEARIQKANVPFYIFKGNPSRAAMTPKTPNETD